MSDRLIDVLGHLEPVDGLLKVSTEWPVEVGLEVNSGRFSLAGEIRQLLQDGLTLHHVSPVSALVLEVLGLALGSGLTISIGVILHYSATFVRRFHETLSATLKP